MKNKNFSFRYILLLAVAAFPFATTAQVQPVANDTSKHAPVAVIPFLPPAPDTNIHVYESPAVRNTVQLIYDYQRYSHGLSLGYRVELDFSEDRNAMNEIKSDFSGKYPSVPSYLTYNQPYFRMSVGDFRTRLDARRFLNTLKKDYPAAFVVSERIVPPPL